MAESNGDDLSATGTHRAWVGETGSPIGASHSVRAGTARDVQRTWLQRAQPTNQRHAAITRSLYSWNNYKSWTDKVKSTFDKERVKDKRGK